MQLEKWLPIDVVVIRKSLCNIYGKGVAMYLST